VQAFVEEYDAPRVRTGMAVDVAADGIPDRVFRGTVSALSPRMDRKQHWTDRPDEQFDTKTREVWIDLENADGLVLGLRVDVTIHPQGVVPHGNPEAEGLPSSQPSPPSGP
jgi:hypothetical protein